MSKFIKSISLFAMASPLLISRSADANSLTPNIDNKESLLEPVSMRPLNYETENLYAAHRSHSSHSSHSSHYSGSGGGYSSSSSVYTSTPVYTPTTVYTPTPVYTPPKSRTSSKSSTTGYSKTHTYKTPSTVYKKPSPVYQPNTNIVLTAPKNPDWDRSTVTNIPNPYIDNQSTTDNQDEVLQRVNQIKRVQMVLLRAGYYKGKIDGSLGQETRQALRNYQTDHLMEPTGRMTTETLNSMGIVGVVIRE